MEKIDEERFTGVSSDGYREGMAGKMKRLGFRTIIQRNFSFLEIKNSKPESKMNKRKRPRTIRTSEEVESPIFTSRKTIKILKQLYVWALAVI